jgi:hypothetical protein
MGKRPGAIYVALQRLDALMADEVTSAPLPVRTEQEASLILFPDGRIPTVEMRTYCQHVVMDFLAWCRDVQEVRDHARIDARADELASLFLREMAEGQPAWSILAQRRVLRLYFQNQELAQHSDLRERGDSR